MPSPPSLSLNLLPCALGVMVFLGAGCAKSHLATDLRDADVLPDGRFVDGALPDAFTVDVSVGRDAAPADTPPDPPVRTSRKVDILVVLDNSGTMGEKQQAFARAMEPFLRRLTADIDGSTRDLRLAVVSTDIGSGGFPIGTCDEPNFGDDGLLQRGDACGGQVAASVDGFGNFVRHTECLMDLGINGCGFEQQLDAMLKSLMPASHPLRFHEDTPGHGGEGANGEFLRDDAYLLVLLLTDEDDCSARDPEIFSRSSTRYDDPNLNLRCWRYPQALHPVQRYVRGLLDLRPDGSVIFAAITGIPADLERPSGPPNYQVLVGPGADPRMIPRPDAFEPSVLTSICRPTVVGYPATRIVGAMQGMEEAGIPTVLGSICNLDYEAVLGRTVDAVNRLVSR